MTTSQLRTLMAGYYHQDFETLWSALNEYLSESNRVQCEVLLTEIDALLLKQLSEMDLETHLDDLGNSADLRGTPGGYRGWLEEIARRVRAHLGE